MRPLPTRSDGRFLLLLGGMLLFPPLLHAQAPGERIKAGVGSGEQAITFRYCPPGVHLVVDLDGKEQKKEAMKGFWISETETPQKVFFDLLSQLKERDLLKAWLDRGAERSVDAYKNRMEEKKKNSSADGDYPIFCLNIIEAALFCQGLSDLQPVRPIKYKFRLPTRMEWQYACRGQSDPKQAENTPFFHAWVNLMKMDLPGTSEAEKRDLAELRKELRGVWNAAKKVGDFDGGQRQTMELLRGGKDRDAVLDYCSFCLKGTLGIDYKFREEKEGTLYRVDQGSDVTNIWGCRHLHGNVAEWLLKDASDWEGLVAGKAPDWVYTGGGNFRPALGAKELGPQRFAIGGEAAVEGRNASSDDDAPRYVAGVRVVIDSEAPNVGPWLRTVRASALKDAGVKERKVWDLGLADLARVKRKEEDVDSARSAIDFYTGVVHLRERDEKQAQKYLADWVGGTRKLAVKARVDVEDVKNRLASLAEQEKDLSAVAPAEAARIHPQLALYVGILQSHSGDPAAGKSLDDWRLNLSRSIASGQPPNKEWLAERAGEMDDLKVGYLEPLRRTNKEEADRLERALREVQALAYVRAGLTVEADQELKKAPAATNRADALYNAGLRRLVRGTGK